MATAVPTIRPAQNPIEIVNSLGLLADLAGTWEGTGFNLIARPDKAGNANTYLELNQTNETLVITPIGSPIPNRGFGQTDIQLFGLTYLQKISDSVTGGALHIEPGIWVTQPPTSYPPEATSDATEQIIARMGNIPHGNSLLAQGIAKPFTGPPTLSPGASAVSGVNPAFSIFPAFNSTPFPAPPAPAQPIFNAAGSSVAAQAPPANGFKNFDLSVTDCVNFPRTPCPSNTPALPANINGVPMQTIINDPITLLQQVINQQVAAGHTFSGVVLNIATDAQVTFLKNANDPNPGKPPSPTVTVNTNGAGGIENMLFLEGGAPVGAVGPNADTAHVYATFWIETVTPKGGGPVFQQLQYAQMVVLNFAILRALPTVVLIGWPHISIATLKKPFA
jgi:hypothetical protein